MTTTNRVSPSPAHRERGPGGEGSTPRQRILLLTQIVPFPPDSGPKIKTLNVLKHLARQHDVHLVSFARTPTEEQAAEALRPWCATVDLIPLRRSRLLDVLALARSFLTGRPFLVERDDSRALRQRVTSLLERYQFDAVHADQLTMGQFATDLPLPLRVLDEHNAVWTIVRRVAQQESWGPRRLVAELEWRRLRTYETALCRQFDRVLVVSENDLADLGLDSADRSRAVVVPIVVDTEALPYVPRGPEAHHVLSMATMFYPPNIEGVIWFGQEIFPLVRDQIETTRFLVVGARPPAHVRDLATETSGIEVAGYVEDLDASLRQSAVLVVPLHSGSGMRVKILEAFARGIPVVSTTIGVEGIDAHHGEHLLVADTPRDFAAAVVDVLRDPRAAARRAEAARALVEQRYSQHRALRDLDAVYPGPALALERIS
jgi:polysaccharide biosynthesis protein PslH